MDRMDDDHFNERDSDETGEDIWERVIQDGHEVAYQDWDSRSPGGGAGRVSVYEYETKFYVSCDDGIHGPFETKAKAIGAGGVDIVSDATEGMWGCD